MLHTVYCYLGILSVAACLTAAPAQSDDNKVALTVDFKGTEGKVVDSIDLTFADLQALPVMQFDTKTIWTSGIQVFTGVRLATLLDSLDIESGELKLHALNDYHITMPVSEATEDEALLAYRRNNKVMTPRENGPLWLVYDYDSNAKYRAETYYTQSIWQLYRITVSR